MKDHEAARMAWQAAEAHWRKEFARVTGLGIDATLEETIEHYMDTVNQAVAWRDELAHGREPQTAETCQHVPPHPRAYVVEKQICGRCSRPWPCLDHPAILQEQLINIQRVKVCLVCEAVKQARELAICGHPVACGIPCYKTKEDMDANQVSHYECAWCQSITQTMKCNRDATLLEAAKALCNDCSLGRRLNPIWNGARKRVDFFHDDASGDNMTGCDAEAIHRLREGVK